MKDFIPHTFTSWCQDNLHKFPQEDQARDPEALLEAKRIFPVPQVVRQALIDLYCPEAIKDSVKRDPNSKACLVRLYLGRVSTPKRIFSLRNFQLHIDQMLNLNMDTLHYAKVMGEAIAVIHWQAQIDARDVEFVLGSAPTKSHFRNLQRLRN